MIRHRLHPASPGDPKGQSGCRQSDHECSLMYVVWSIVSVMQSLLCSLCYAVSVMQSLLCSLCYTVSVMQSIELL